MMLSMVISQLRSWMMSAGLDAKFRIVLVFENERDARCMQVAIHQDLRDGDAYLREEQQGRDARISGVPIRIGYEAEEAIMGRVKIKTTRMIT